MSLFSILVDISANTANMEAGMRRAAESIEKFGDKAKEAATMAAEFFGVSVGVEALSSAIETAVSRGENLSRLADRMHTTTESLSELQYAAQMTGVNFDALTGAFDRMQKNVGMAAEGSGRAKTAIADLHLSASKLLALPFDQQLSVIANAFQKIQNPAQQTQLAMQLFGNEGAALVPFLKLGAAGIDELRAEADKLGITLTSEGAAKLKEAGDAMKQVHAETTALSSELAIAFAPALETVAGWLVKGTQGLITFGRELHLLQPTSEMAALSEKLTALQNLYQHAAATLSGMNDPGLFTKFMNSKGWNPFSGNQLDKNKADQQKYIESLKAQMDEVNTAILAEEKKLSGDTNKGTPTAKADPTLGFKPNQQKEYIDKMKEFYDTLDKLTQTDTEKTINATIEKEVAINEQLKSGQINAEEYTKRMDAAFDQALPGLQNHLKTIAVQSKATLNEMQQLGQGAAQSIQTSFANFIFKPSIQGFKDMLKSWITTLAQMVAEALAKKALLSLFGSGSTGTSSGGLGDLIGGLLTGGPKAGGGPVDPGKSYLVGEKGPELFSPGSSGTIIPNGAGGSLNFAPVYNINAPNGDQQLRAALPQLLAQTAARSKRDVIDAFQRAGFASPRMV